MTLVLFFIAPPEDTPLAAFYMITGGGTAISVAVGFWLHNHMKNKAALNAG